MNDGYLGNPLLKRGGTPIEWTPELLKEYMRCADDPIYFAENYIKIVHVDRGFIPIELYDFQKDIVNSISKHRRVVVNASRQAGKCVSINTIVTIKIQENILNITMGELHETILEEKNIRFKNVIPRWDRICRMFDLWIQVPNTSLSFENTQYSQGRLFRRYTNSNTSETKKQNCKESLGAPGLQKPVYWTRRSIVALEQTQPENYGGIEKKHDAENGRKQNLYHSTELLASQRSYRRRGKSSFTRQAEYFYAGETRSQIWKGDCKRKVAGSTGSLAEYTTIEAGTGKDCNKSQKGYAHKLQYSTGRVLSDRKSSDSLFNQVVGYGKIEDRNNIQRFECETSTAEANIHNSKSMGKSDCGKGFRDRTINTMEQPGYGSPRREFRDISPRYEGGTYRDAGRLYVNSELGISPRESKDNVKEKSLHSRTNRKFVEVYDVSDIHVLTPTGWEPISHFNVTIPYRKYRVEFSSNQYLDCADDHILICEDGSEIYAKDCVGSIIQSEKGPVLVSSVSDAGIEETMYDLSVDSADHVYYTNGILSHNTTTAVAIILHYILFNEYKTVALLANKAASALEILNRIQMAFEALPPWLQQGVVTWNKGSMELENGCKVLAAASSSSSIRGKSIAFLYIDETAFLNNWEEFFASVYPTISSGKETKILLTSTPNSLNHFWKICKEAQEDVNEIGQGKNGYIYKEVRWDAVPGRDEAWKEDTLASISWNMEQFSQEFDCSFVGSQNTLISGSKLKELSFTVPIAESEGIKQFNVPNKESTYVTIVDVSRGKGLDYSTFSILDVTKMPYEQVCTFRDNYVGPVDYASIIYRMSKLYNESQVLIEINDIGGQVADTLFFEYGYENMLFTESAGRSGKRISGGFGKNVDRGIRTTKSVKATGCSILKLLVEQNQILIRDFHTIQELARFSRKGVSYEAESGAHDDMVMTLVLFAWLTDQSYFKDMTDINTLIKLREISDEQMDEQLLPFGFIDDGNDFEQTYF